MTPLAQAILNDYAEPRRRRRFQSNGCETDVPKELLRAVPFEISGVYPMVAPLGLKMSEVRDGLLGDVKDNTFAFLPAETTWIEWRDERDPPGRRCGYLLMEAEDLCLAVLCGSQDGWLGAVAEFAIPLEGHKDFGKVSVRDPLVPEMSREMLGFFVRDLYPILAIINTPRVIGRRQHMPHAGLQRRLAAAHRMPGKYPLHAWHEVVLEVTPPRADEGDHEARLTGGKALHFCRQHLRVQNGKLVLVSAHWRGDPALGMKQTRYRVVPPRVPARAEP